MTRVMFSFLVLLLALFRVDAVQANDWKQWRGPERNGISRETEWTHDWPGDGPPIVWKTSVGVGFSSMVIGDGRLFTLGNQDETDTVYCLDAETGATLWTHSYSAPLDDKFFEGGPTSTPTIDGAFVYTLSRQGDLFCFAAASGQIRWSKNIAEEARVRIPGWGFAASPVVQGDTLLVGVGESGTALNKHTGELLWTSADADAGYATPLPVMRDGKAHLLVASGKYFHLVDLADGQEAWRVKWLTRFGCNAADPIVAGDRVFLSSGYNRGSALLRLTDSDPDELWKSKEFQNQFSSSVLIDNHLYGIDGDDTGERQLKCVDWETGVVRWSAAGFGTGALMAADKRLVILSELGELVIAAATPDAFQPLARAQVLHGKTWTVPVLANRRIYGRAADGELVCVDVRR